MPPAQQSHAQYPQPPEVYTTMVAALHAGPMSDARRAALSRVARHRIIDRYRARAREAQRFVIGDSAGDEPERITGQWLAPAADGPEGAYLRARVVQVLTEALQSLPSEQREVFMAHEFDGRSFKPLSADTGIPINTLLSRKHTAVTALRERLASYQSWLDEISEYFP
jgi:RNA polymerase sigma factor (sigma-70 family)